jgi:hypothetical protein
MFRRSRSLFLAAVLSATVATGLTLSFGSAAVAAPTAVANTLTNIPVSGQCENAVTGVEGTFTGTLTINQFASQKKKVVALGTLSGTCSVGGTISNAAVTVPVRIAQATCEVLTLVLGPLHLELLGLIIDLNRVVLTITADPSGGLLGQLLCALAGGGPLQQIVNLLNQILAILQGL